MTIKQSFKVGDKVVDLMGLEGTVVKVTHFDGTHWYDVRFSERGVSVRYESDLKFATKA